MVASWRQRRPRGQKTSLTLERAGQCRVRWHLLAGPWGSWGEGAMGNEEVM